MAVEPQYEADVQAILAHKEDNGADLWATPDKRLLKGAPFTTIECPLYLLELGMEPDAPVLRQTAALIFSTWQPDGRFKIYPSGGMMPCHTALSANTLCALGFAADERMQTTFAQLLANRYEDGGWRCNKFSYGRGPETEHSNPFPTLTVLDAFRRAGLQNTQAELAAAVEFLLWHWTERKPVGPCHYGMGTLFMQTEYPFRGYNLFYYLYVLSFYDAAKRDARFLAALDAFEATLQEGQVVVQRVVPKLAKLTFCKKGEPSATATRRYHEILRNLGRKPAG